MSFVERVIVITITLQARQGLPAGRVGRQASANPTFAWTNSNTVRIFGGGAASRNGVRISAKIARPGGVSLGQANVLIYNLPLALINQIGTLGTPYIFEVGANTIIIEAGDEGGQLQPLFKGTITSAYGDFSGMPESVFNIAATAFGIQTVMPASATSLAGTRDVATIMAGLAARGGLKFINNGVTVQLSNPYLSGSLHDQIKALAIGAGVSWQVDDVKGELIIWPKNGSNSAPGAALPLIAPPPKGNMVGYPAYTANGLLLRTEFETVFRYGQNVEVQSSLTQANGTWTVVNLDYDLEVQAPDGPWFTNMALVAPGYATLPPALLS